MNRILYCLVWIAMLLSMGWVSASRAADAAAGKALAQVKCAACHEPADWQGETQNNLQALLRDVVSGKVKHSKVKIELSETEIANIAAYWLSVKK